MLDRALATVTRPGGEMVTPQSALATLDTGSRIRLRMCYIALQKEVPYDCGDRP